MSSKFVGLGTKDNAFFKKLSNNLINMKGYDFYYIPKIELKVNPITGQSSINEYKKAYLMQGLLQGLRDFTGGERSINKFGLTWLLQQGITITIELFKSKSNNELTRPKHKDLIYIPIFDKFFQVKGKDDEKDDFYNHGTKQIFYIPIEMWRFSGEVINTGITLIDSKVPTDIENTTKPLNDEVEILADKNLLNNEFGAFKSE
jgi:hypothetical protein